MKRGKNGADQPHYDNRMITFFNASMKEVKKDRRDNPGATDQLLLELRGGGQKDYEGPSQSDLDESQDSYYGGYGRMELEEGEGQEEGEEGEEERQGRRR